MGFRDLGPVVLFTRSNILASIFLDFLIQKRSDQIKNYKKIATMTPDTPEAKIVELFNRRREGLSLREWSEFYKLVVPVLERTRLPDYAWSPEEREDLIVSFFERKIYRNARTSEAKPIVEAYQLKGFLKNYANAYLRARKLESETMVSAELDEERVAAMRVPTLMLKKSWSTLALHSKKRSKARMPSSTRSRRFTGNF